MNLSDITTQPYILALFKRDDGTRFLLGLGAYEFKDSQQHFIANTMVNDVVDMQGTDGALLAGQVRRASTQSFDGYVGDGGVIKSTVEQYRKDFIAYFQKNHFYTVIYIFSDGTAIQRKRGYIIDSPEVKELYQMAPEYHVALNFEDVNYYKYAENSDGDEIYSNTANITSKITTTGGLIWSNISTVPITGEGTNFTLYGTVAEENLQSVQLKGQTSQQTYTGKNLVYTKAGIDGGITFAYDSITGATTITGQQSYGFSLSQQVATNLPAGTYTVSIDAPQEIIIGVGIYDSSDNRTAEEIPAGQTSLTFTAIAPIAKFETIVADLDSGTTYNLTFKLQLESGSTATTFEPYVGGTASPNPDYPQEVQTVTGRQVVTISDGGSESQEYEINLGKNLLKNLQSAYINATDNGVSNTLNSDGSMTCSGTVGSGWNGWNISGYIANSLPAGTYTFSIDQAISYDINVSFRDSSNNTLDTAHITAGQTSSTVTINGQIAKTSLWLSATTSTAINFTIKPQVEKGSSVSPFAPYFTPIELCKIGTYQDYIYKSGDDWFLHKETKKAIYDGSESWIYAAEANHERFVLSVPNAALSSWTFDGTITEKSDQFEGVTWRTLYSAQSLGLDNLISGHDSGHYIIVRSTKFTSASAWKTWLGSHNLTTYYALATPTDTQITDADLISDLNDLLGADTYSPSTAFEITATNDLPAWLSVSAHSVSGGVVWDNIGATWEEGGEGGDSFVTVDSISDVFPTITIIGAANNPKITNITTGQVLQYTGNVARGQKLVIDVQQKTAKLSGTSVITNVSGDWLYLKPGINRIAYTIDNATVNYATIEWQEITG